ncbi:MAG TPA: hypothetical protein VMI35_11105 [Puia sp.]|nr:hypothetical protein [Puia sp.]
MKKFLLFFSVATMILAAACNKTTNLPPYAPVVPVIFSVSSLKHTQDTVNIGDTIYLTATGTMYDTTKNIYVYLASSYTASGVASVYNFGSAASPVKLSRVIGTQTNNLWGWTSTIMLTGATFVPAKTKLSITGNFIYQLSLSSQQGTLSAADAGQSNKTVFVQ